MFFEHAGSAVAVDLATDDVTDVFDRRRAAADPSWTLVPRHRGRERRATLIARSALATNVDPLRTFPSRPPVRANARQARHWSQVYAPARSSCR